ncbi:MAG: hypothetical protein BA874_00695 [Desulfuromonadales bacterium C00003068]|jgi:hypothetical protein|nr:MAG: hypothetical protein BA874_00695 [Desulfuromonadales bacterium C00003068]
MSLEQLQETVMALSTEEKQQFILNTLPEMAKEAMQDPSFMMQLLPVFLGIVKESGLDIQQLLQFAALHGGGLGGQES